VRISIGLLVTIFAIVYFTYFISFIVKSLLINAGGLNKQIERGARLSIAQLLQYIIITVGFVLLLYVLGLKLTQLTIILSALGIGIGFGLQNIVNNFISGLILLFERPIRVEDIIETQGRRARLKHIGLRSTVILTFDEEEVIVPNSDLVSEEVTNLTLSSRMIRTKIPVGVAYGSDVNLVLETLVLCAKGHNLVAKVPEPQSVFINFGDSSLNFELWVWILDAERMLYVTSDLLQEIDRRFRKNNIEIAFPQRDLHIRSVDQSIGSLSPENKK
jgi:small-conductance mechanosensitive channel